MKNGVTINLYDDQALGWKISRDGSMAILDVHGSMCMDHGVGVRDQIVVQSRLILLPTKGKRLSLGIDCGVARYQIPQKPSGAEVILPPKFIRLVTVT